MVSTKIVNSLVCRAVYRYIPSCSRSRYTSKYYFLGHWYSFEVYSLVNYYGGTTYFRVFFNLRREGINNIQVIRGEDNIHVDFSNLCNYK